MYVNKLFYTFTFTPILYVREKNTSNATARPKGRPTPLSRPGTSILNTLLEKCIAYGISNIS